MKRIFQYMFLALILSMVSFSLDSCRKKGIIDDDVLSQIYAEMLMTDQWINSTTGIRLVADTSLVYEPILRKYGFTSEDYRNTVEHYLKDPEEYADIMKGTIDILDERLVELKRLKGIQQQDKDRQAFIKKVGKDARVDQAWMFVDKLKDERYGKIDSLSIVWDSLAYSYKMVSVPWSERSEKADSLSARDSLPSLDSLYVLDSLAVLDSLPALDSLSVKDSLPKRDSILNLETVRKPMSLRGVDKSVLRKNASLNVSDSLSKVK